jgi:hypothetical protein
MFFVCYSFVLHVTTINWHSLVGLCHFINCIPTYFVHPWIIMVIIILCKWHIVEHIEIVGSNIGTKTYLWNLARKQPWNSSVVSYYQDAWMLMYLKYMGMKAIELNYLGISKPSNGYWIMSEIFSSQLLNLFDWNFPSPRWWMSKPKIEIREMVSTWCSFEGKMKSNACLLQCANVHVGDFINV